MVFFEETFDDLIARSNSEDKLTFCPTVHMKNKTNLLVNVIFSKFDKCVDHKPFDKKLKSDVPMSEDFKVVDV